MARRRPPSPDRILRNQRKAFVKRFGREPGPDDPVFFDPDALGDVPQPISSEAMRNDVLKAMIAAGIAPAIGYAHAKTGYLVVKGFEDRFTPEALAEWQAAIEEYRQLEAKGHTS